MFFCDICLKSIENHDNYRRHMEVLHSESIVLYLCPLCDLELRWPKNFPAHYEKSHHKSYQEGLEMAKSLKTRVVVIKEYLGSSNSIQAITTEGYMDDETIPLKKAKLSETQKNILDAHKQTCSNTLSTRLNLQRNSKKQNKDIPIVAKATPAPISNASSFVMNSDSFPSPRETVEVRAVNKTSVLFDHKVEMFRHEQWEKGTIKLMKESSDPLVVRLSLWIGEQCELDELLTAQSKFTSTSKTMMSWLATDFSQGDMRTVNFVVRFKQSKIQDKFLKVWQSVRNQMLNGQKTTTRSHDTGEVDSKLVFEIQNSSKVLVESKKWTCPGCFVENNMDDLMCSCCNTKNQQVNSSVDRTSSKQSNTLVNFGGKFVPFQIGSITKSNHDESSINEDEKTILFDHHATVYRHNLNKWEERGVGNMKIIPNTNGSHTVQLLLHRETDSTIVCDQTIDQNTCFDDAQKSTGVLSWMSSEQQQWAVKFDDSEICQQFHDIILVATAVSGTTPSNFSSTKLLDEILEFSTKESADDLKKRCVSAQIQTKVRNFSRDLQTWHHVNAKLGITSGIKRRYYERVCENLNRCLSPTASSESNQKSNT